MKLLPNFTERIIHREIIFLLRKMADHANDVSFKYGFIDFKKWNERQKINDKEYDKKINQII